jgi:hypothetical protein
MMPPAAPAAPVDAGWRTFLMRACVFALPLLVGLSAIELQMSRVPNAYGVKRLQVEAGRAAIEGLVRGSLHEFEGVDADVFSRPSYNLAMPSQSLSQSAELALQYVQTHRLRGRSTGAELALPKLRYILLGVSAYSLPYRMSTTGDSRLGFYFRAYGVRGDATWSDLVNPSNYLYMGIYGWPAVQSMLRTGVAADYVGHLTRTGGSPGVKGAPAAPPAFLAATAVARAQYHHAIAVSANIPINLAFMRRLARQCQATGVTLVLFTSPVTKEYADAFGDDVWLPRRAAIEALAAEFHLAYTDYSRNDLFTSRDFANADHLNADGAEKFGRLLSNQLF